MSSRTQCPCLEHTIDTLSSHLAQTTTHQTTLLLALHKHFTLPLLTMRPASRLVTAYTRLSHALRKTKHRLNHIVVIAPAILHEVRLVADALSAILRDGTLLVTDIQRLTAEARERDNTMPPLPPTTSHGPAAKANSEGTAEGRDREKHAAAGLRAAKEHLAAMMDEFKRRRSVRGEVSERMAVLAQRVVRLRRRAVKAVRK